MCYFLLANSKFPGEGDCDAAGRRRISGVKKKMRQRKLILCEEEREKPEKKERGGGGRRRMERLTSERDAGKRYKWMSARFQRKSHDSIRQTSHGHPFCSKWKVDFLQTYYVQHARAPGKVRKIFFLIHNIVRR